MTAKLTLEEFTTKPSDPLGTYINLSKVFGSERVFLMESLGGPEKDNRFSMSGLSGKAEVIIRKGVVTVTGEVNISDYIREIIKESGLVYINENELRLVSDDAFWQLPRELSRSFIFEDKDENLATSFLTFYGYDAVRYIEQLPRLIEDSEHSSPDAVYSLVDTLITHREDSTEISIVESDIWETTSDAEVVGCLAKAVDGRTSSNVPTVPEPTSVSDDISEEEYLRRGEQCLEHIRVGDIYQVQLGHSITIESQADPFDVYQRIRWRNPSPYMALMHIAGSTIVCASPELFIRADRSSVVMRPIAGTAPRGGDEERVRELLLNDPKERAEHLMLVDLCRNDLSKIARDGSVDTTTFMVIEEYSHVFHIVSEVKCDTAVQTDIYDVVRACFPAGTMSGAPKVRAMEIIESLETSRRGFYAGAFGLVSLNGRDSVLGLAIRMAVYSRGKFTLRASAGFVSDSDARGEWQETLNKLASTYWAVSGKEIR